MGDGRGGVMPSTVSDDVSWFDRFAGWASGMVSRAWFFVACVAAIVVWALSYPLWQNGDTYQLVVNTGTTIVTFLLVALLQNSQQRADQAVQHKLNAVAEGLANLLAELGDDDFDEARVRSAAAELRTAVGLEQKESS
jgi:Na+/proline symporter